VHRRVVGGDELGGENGLDRVAWVQRRECVQDGRALLGFVCVGFVRQQWQGVADAAQQGGEGGGVEGQRRGLWGLRGSWSVLRVECEDGGT
jgi:hypothetical protein